MSAQAQPIDPARFALAVEELPLEQIYAKAAELHNQVFHLRRSNVVLKEYADQGDADCVEAYRENEEVVERVEFRLHLLKVEVERRGSTWSEHGGARGSEEQEQQGQQASASASESAEDGRGLPLSNGARSVQDGNMATEQPQNEVNGVTAGHGSTESSTRGSGRLTDEQLARLMRARMEDDVADDDGIDL